MLDTIRCKFCGYDSVVKYGKTSTDPRHTSMQRYQCAGCYRIFLNNTCPPRMRISSELLGRILTQYYEGMSIDDIREQLELHYNVSPSRSTIYRWIVKFTTIAITRTKDYSPAVGDTWIITKSTVRISRKLYWLIDTTCLDTRYILSTVLLPKHSSKYFRIPLLLAIEKAGQKRPAILLVTNNLGSYHDETESVVGLETQIRYIQNHNPIYHNNTDQTDIYQLMKEHTKAVQGFKTFSASKTILQGWCVNHNFCRRYKLLGDKTPAEFTGINTATGSWQDLISKPPFMISDINGTEYHSAHSNCVPLSPAVNKHSL